MTLEEPFVESYNIVLTSVDGKHGDPANGLRYINLAYFTQQYENHPQRAEAHHQLEYGNLQNSRWFRGKMYNTVQKKAGS